MAKKGNKFIVGIILLIVAGLCVFWGFNEAGSFGGKLGSAISGSPSDRVLMFYVVGVICGVLGLFFVVKK